MDIAIVALLVLVAAAGTVIPVLPGVLLAGGSIGVWAALNGQWWLVVAVVILSTAALILKVAIPARTARDAASTAALAVGAVAGLVGLFTIPVVGLPAGFLVGVFAAEWLRLRDPAASWTATRATVKSLGVSMIIEFGSVLLMTALWVAAVISTTS